MTAQFHRVLEAFAEDMGASVAAGTPPNNMDQMNQVFAQAWREESDEPAELGNEEVQLRVRFRTHHRPPSGVNSPRTQHAGDIANDLLVMAAQPNDDVPSVYLYFADEEMSGYLDNPDNGLNRLFGLRTGEAYLLPADSLRNRARTFVKRLKAPMADVHLTSLLKRDYSGGYVLRVWQVTPSPARNPEASRTDELRSPSGAQNTTSSSADHAGPVASGSATAARLSVDVPKDWHELLPSARRMPIEPERDVDGRVRHCQPQQDYENRDEVELNSYGKGSFCRFRVPPKINHAGVYLIVTDDRLAYIGECQDLARRFNTGYGQISPKNCYKGGQETNCRINQLILKCAESGWSIDVYFIETAAPADRFALESAYIAAFSPAWNRAR